MKNKFWKKVNTAIELTSLLDVIFIVLMVVICNQQINLTERESKSEAMMQEAIQMQDEAVQMQDEAAEILADRTMYSEQLDTYENMAQQLTSIVVYVDYVPSDITSRRIRMLVGTEELPEIGLNPSNTDTAFAEFEKTLKSIVENDADRPVIIALDNENILYRDDVKVREILDRMLKEHQNLYLKAAAGEQDK